MYFWQPRSEWSWPFRRWHDQLTSVPSNHFFEAFFTSHLVRMLDMRTDLANDEHLHAAFRAFAKRVGFNDNRQKARYIGDLLVDYIFSDATGLQDLKFLSFPRARLVTEVINNPREILSTCMRKTLINRGLVRFNNMADYWELIERVSAEELFPLLDNFIGTAVGPETLAQVICFLVQNPETVWHQPCFIQDFGAPTDPILRWAIARSQDRPVSFFPAYITNLFTGLPPIDLDRDVFWLVGRLSGAKLTQHRTMLADALADPSIVDLFNSKKAVRQFLQGYSADATNQKLDRLLPKPRSWTVADRKKFFASDKFKSFFLELDPLQV